MGGYNGKLIRVDLTKGTIKVENLDMEMAGKYIGGRGIGTKILTDEVSPKVDALSPENKLIFMTGPLSGTNTPTGGRYMVITKSPLTGTVACSNSGGYWGAELKFAGYDGIIFEGKSEKPVYLNIENEKIELKDASSVWGKLVSDTTHELVKAHGEKVKVAAIGPAGENLSLIAAIMNDIGRAAGRSGVGAVMGSKNLKAVVVRGTGTVAVSDNEKLKEAASVCMKKIKENGVTGQGLPAYGTAVLVNIINENGAFPFRNFQGSNDAKAEEISGEMLAEKYLTKKDPCFRCPIACGRYCKVDEIEGSGPEYETIWAYGADCGISNLGNIIKANFWCNEIGVDTISAGTTLAAAMELFEKGKIKAEEFGAETPLEFGNDEAIITWTKKMADKDGLGAKLAQGSYRLCEMYGAPELSMTVKKQEMPAYDPRGIQGIGLNYATSNRGGCHVRGYMISPEILGLPEKLDKLATDGKANWTRIFQDFTAAIDASGLCLFTSFAMGADDYAALMNGATGSSLTGADFIKAGERIWNLEKQFNLESGVGPSQDTLPKRLLNDAIAEGPAKGYVNKLDQMLPEYYSLRGWDKHGIPTAEKLKELGL